jgi:D-lactate dehydrogenase
MKITIFDTENAEIEKFQEALKNHETQIFNESIQAVNLSQYKDSDIISVFINSKVTKELIGSMPNLKYIITRSTGFEHIDMGTCKDKGIKVSNVPLYGENTVAEHTFALILCLSRNIHKTYIRTINNNFSLSNLRGFDLKGKTLGVIGAGKIGLHLIRMAKGFGMNVLAFDINKNDFLGEVLDFKYTSIEDILKNADVISLHAPLNKATYHLINKDNIHQIKKGAILINTSRGSLIETAALIEALNEGILAGAGLDVFEGEEYILEEGCRLNDEYTEDVKRLINQNCSLPRRENVVITPHNAFNSIEAVERIFNTTIDNVMAFVNGKPINLV